MVTKHPGGRPSGGELPPRTRQLARVALVLVHPRAESRPARPMSQVAVTQATESGRGEWSSR